MELLIEIKTPKGQATKVAYKLTKALLPRRLKYKTWTNKNDDTIYWEIEGQPKDCLKVNKNVATYDTIMRGALSSKMVQAQAKKSLSIEDQEQLKDMLLNQTKVKVIKVSEKEKKEIDGRTWWQKIKDQFTTKD